MTKAFLPEYSQMPVGDRYRPLFKLFAGESWRFVRKDGKPVECSSAAEATTAAKDCVKRILNPAIRSQQIGASPPTDALADEVTLWRQRRAQEAEEEKQRAFGVDRPSTVFLRGGKTVAVEYKRRRV